MKNLLLALTLVFLLPATLARAAPPSQAEAQALARQFVAAAIESAAGIGGTLTADGAPVVTETDGLYQAQLPHMVLTTADGVRVDLGQPKAALMPAAGGSWRLGLVMPPVMVSRPGEAPFTLALGDQDITATWSSGDTAIGTLHFRCSGVTATGGVAGTIGALTLDLALNPSFGGGRRGPLTLNAANIALTMAPGASFRLASLALHGDLETLSPTAARAGVAGVVLHGIAQGATIARPAGKTLPARTYAVPEADLDIAARGNGADNDEAQVDARYAGLTVSPAGSDPSAPAHLAFSAHFSSLPAGGLIAMLREVSASLMSDVPKKQAKQAREAMLHLLEQAHTHIDVKTLAFGNDVYDARGNGAVTMSDTSPSGAVGSATATATGLDQLLSALNGEPPTMQLTVLQLVGKPGAGGARRYDVEWRQDGPILFNGQDVSALLQGAQALSGFKINIQ